MGNYIRVSIIRWGHYLRVFYLIVIYKSSFARFRKKRNQINVKFEKPNIVNYIFKWARKK